MLTESIATFTANGQQLAMDVSMFNVVTFAAVVSGSVVGHAVSFEYSQNTNNGVDGNWFPLPCLRVATSSTIESATGTLAATPAYTWRANVTGIKWVRARVTGHTSGAMVWQIDASNGAATDTQPNVGTGTITSVGNAAHDAVVSGNPLRIAGRSVTTNYTATAAGDVADLATTLQGAAIIKENAPYGSQWRASGTLTTTSDLVLRAAQGTGIFNALTDLILQNTNATATIVNIKDGSTTIGQISLPASMTMPVIINLKTPLLSTANAALNIAAVTTGANVLVTASGFSGA